LVGIGVGVAWLVTGQDGNPESSEALAAGAQVTRDTALLHLGGRF
jgi:hypothetical protein